MQVCIGRRADMARLEALLCGQMDQTQILLLLSPIIVIEIGLIIYALRDLLRPERTVRGESKLMWGLIICFISLIGPILYLTVGRQEE